MSRAHNASPLTVALSHRCKSSRDGRRAAGIAAAFASALVAVTRTADSGRLERPAARDWLNHGRTYEKFHFHTRRRVWQYQQKSTTANCSCSPVNRGVAVAHWMVFPATLDAHLDALGPVRLRCQRAPTSLRHRNHGRHACDHRLSGTEHPRSARDVARVQLVRRRLMGQRFGRLLQPERSRPGGLVHQRGRRCSDRQCGCRSELKLLQSGSG